MQELYIKFENNTICDHPITKPNLQAIYKDIDLNETTPSGYIRFVRKLSPDVASNQKAVFNGYKIEDNIATDDWLIETIYVETTNLDEISTPDDV